MYCTSWQLSKVLAQDKAEDQISTGLSLPVEELSAIDK
jgi:hypothetical protein